MKPATEQRHLDSRRRVRGMLAAAVLGSILMSVPAGPDPGAQTLGGGVMGNGGGDLSGAGKTIRGTIGQPVAGRTTGPGEPDHLVRLGWWFVEPAIVLAVGESTPRPSGPVDLRPPAPNPSQGRVAVTYSLPRPARVELTVFDIAGARIRTLVAGGVEAGPHTAHWDGLNAAGTRCPSGLYLITLRTDGRPAVTRRFVLMR